MHYQNFALREITSRDLCRTIVYRSAGRELFQLIRGFAQKVENPTNGSWWMFQVQPTDSGRVQNFGTFIQEPANIGVSGIVR